MCNSNHLQYACRVCTKRRVETIDVALYSCFEGANLLSLKPSFISFLDCVTADPLVAFFLCILTKVLSIPKLFSQPFKHMRISLRGRRDLAVLSLTTHDVIRSYHSYHVTLTYESILIRTRNQVNDSATPKRHD
jgi:hypothetical protein